MTREEAKNILIREQEEDPWMRTEHRKKVREAIDIGIKALERESETDGDCISRQAVLDELDRHKYSNEFCEEHHIDWSINLGMAHIVIKDLSSVNPQEPKVGRNK